MHLQLTSIIRTRRPIAVLGAVALAASGLALATASPTHAAARPFTDRVSVTTGGFHAGSGTSRVGGASRQTNALSTDGRFAVFESSAPMTNRAGQARVWQIFVRDRKLGTTTLVSVGHRGQLANHNSDEAVMSEDGRYVAFRSTATNLVPGDTNDKSDVFVRDLRRGTTTRVSTSASGGQLTIPGNTPVGAASPAISPDGRYVGFISHAKGLTSDDEPGAQAYLKDTVTGAIEVVSRNSLGATGHVVTGSSLGVSRGGKKVSFLSLDAFLVPGENNHDTDVFVRDRSAGTTTLVAAGEDGSKNPVMNTEGTHVAFVARNAEVSLPGAPAGIDQVYIRDLATGTTLAASRHSDGAWANDHSKAPAISRDGRHVSFNSFASNLVGGDTNRQADVFRHDTATGRTIRVSLRSNGTQSSHASGITAISGNGMHVLFESHAPDITPLPTSNWGNVFVRSVDGSYPAMRASVGILPTKTPRATKRKVRTTGIAAGQPVKVVWKQGKRRTTNNLSVRSNAITLKAPKRHGKYKVTVSYAGKLLRTRTIQVR
ncbi:TolB family protein [Nocardioides sp. Bht2]|uniref:TolB family protein n=1 Tax=Nocardioides sp. Bht2 TaxID=3392297 RepID=UPI0039B3D90A